MLLEASGAGHVYTKVRPGEAYETQVLFLPAEATDAVATSAATATTASRGPARRPAAACHASVCASSARQIDRRPSRTLGWATRSSWAVAKSAASPPTSGAEALDLSGLKQRRSRNNLYVPHAFIIGEYEELTPKRMSMAMCVLDCEESVLNLFREIVQENIFREEAFGDVCREFREERRL